MLNRQEIFNTVYVALVKQGEPSKSKFDRCCYKGVSGLKSSIGHLILDQDYKPSMEKNSVDSLIFRGLLPKYLIGNIDDTKFLVDLEDAHDEMGHETKTKWLSYFKKEMKRIADVYNLTVPSL
jgi:hypothetical protein